MPEETKPDPAQTADQEEGGWSVESHSAPPTPTSADSTVEAPAGGKVPAASDEQAAAAVGDDDDDLAGDGEQTPAGQSAAAAATPDGEKPPAGKTATGKKHRTWQRRVDKLTATIEAERAEKEQLRRRVEALEREPGRPADPKPVAGTKPAAAAPAVERKAMPEPPKYLDYQTEDEFTAAMTKWRGDVAVWQTENETRLKTEITGELDQRLSRQHQEAAFTAHQQAVEARFTKLRDDHPDFTDLVEANSEALDGIQSVFLQDLVVNTEDGGELLYDLAKDPDLALALGELPLPTRPLADAVRSSPAARSLMKYFGTDDGRKTFLALRKLPPARVQAEVGRLEERLEAAGRGSARGAREPITSAIPPAKPPVGTPRARASTPATPSGAPTDTFEAWMASEDAKEDAERQKTLRSMGLVT